MLDCSTLTSSFGDPFWTASPKSDKALADRTRSPGESAQPRGSGRSGSSPATRTRHGRPPTVPHRSPLRPDRSGLMQRRRRIKSRRHGGIRRLGRVGRQSPARSGWAAAPSGRPSRRSWPQAGGGALPAIHPREQIRPQSFGFKGPRRGTGFRAGAPAFAPERREDAARVFLLRTRRDRANGEPPVGDFQVGSRNTAGLIQKYFDSASMCSRVKSRLPLRTSDRTVLLIPAREPHRPGSLLSLP